MILDGSGTKMPTKDDYYREEDWSAKGDAFKKSPHLDEAYRCGVCKEHTQAVKEVGGDALCAEVIAQCLSCGQIYLALVNRRHFRKDGQG